MAARADDGFELQHVDQIPVAPSAIVFLGCLLNGWGLATLRSTFGLALRWQLQKRQEPSRVGGAGISQWLVG
jgi:hypothetical protein